MKTLEERFSECLGIVKIRVQPFITEKTLIAFVKTACKSVCIFMFFSHIYQSKILVATKDYLTYIFQEQ